jgi:hypothetical protein
MAHQFGHVQVVPPGEDQSLGELVATATKDISALIRMEKELAISEVREKVKSTLPMAAGGILIAVCGLPAVLMFSTFVALGIGTWVGNMWGFLCMAGFWAIVMAAGGVFALMGMRKLQRTGGPKPERTIRSIRDTADWARHPTAAPAVKADTMARS